jgi:NNP family nitrate/nitrite transporter-like MFS transporter
MPAIYDSLKKQQHLSSHVAWRVSFIVPFIMITSVALCLVLLTEDTPTGKWSERAAALQANHSTNHTVVPTTGGLDEKPPTTGSISSGDEKKHHAAPTADVESATGEVQVIDGYQHEVVQKPTLKESMRVLLSPQTIMLASGYFNSFGGELAINSVLGAYYLKNFPYLGQTTSGRWAAMFGLLNIITRPLGGFAADTLYRKTGGNLWAKKLWINFLGVVTGTILIIIGKLNPHDQNTMFGLIALMAIFLEAGNGANFALVPHIHPHANGKSSNRCLTTRSTHMLTPSSFRHPIRHRRRNRKLWRHHLCHHLPVQQHRLRARLLDHRHHDDRHEPHVCVGQPHPQGPDWRPLKGEMSLRVSFFFCKGRAFMIPSAVLI